MIECHTPFKLGLTAMSVIVTARVRRDGMWRLRLRGETWVGVLLEMSKGNADTRLD